MKFIKKHKIAIIFYLVMVTFTFIISARVENLESQEDYLKYSNNVAMNNIN